MLLQTSAFGDAQRGPPLRSEVISRCMQARQAFTYRSLRGSSRLACPARWKEPWPAAVCARSATVYAPMWSEAGKERLLCAL